MFSRAFPGSLFGLLSIIPFSGIAGDGKPVDDAKGPRPVFVSDQLDKLLMTNSFARGLTVVDTNSGAAKQVSDGVNAGQYPSISPDGSTVCFKEFVDTAQGRLQVPTIYDVASGAKTAMSDAVAQAGTPAIAADGSIAFTVGNELRLLNPDKSLRASYDLGSHVNLVSFSPDGGTIAYADAHGIVTAINSGDGSRTQVTNGSKPFWQVRFSPNGDSVLLRAADGSVSVVPVASPESIKHLGKAVDAAWNGASSVALVERVRGENDKVLETVVNSHNLGSGKKKKIASQAGAADVSLNNGSIAISDGSALNYGFVTEDQAATMQLSTASPSESGDTSIQSVVDTGSTIELVGIPYLHQVYDTADWWNGNSSCNAAAALMCINYFDILPPRPITCSTPFSHTHNHGWYVSELYSWNGRTYNIPSRDPNRRIGYGGFGYITQNNWENTKDHMAEYISYHGPASAVDWSPTLAKAKTEINNDCPAVVLTDLTSAGHYPTLSGYHETQNTLIFTDPYGDKNLGYTNYNGQRAFYDWPGYNNGYQNLNTVWCYIYARLTLPPAATRLVATAESSAQVNLTWTDVATNEANYIVARGTASGGPYTDIATLPLNATSYSDSGLSSAPNSYYYVVRAVNKRGASANSNEANTDIAPPPPPPPPPADIIIDNASAGFTASANWSTNTKASGRYGADCRLRATQAISDAAVWTFTVPESRNYEIFAWWSAAKTRASNAPYIMPDGAVVNKNQTTAGGQWNSLGVKTLSAGTHIVRLSCWTNSSNNTVCADAIKVVAK